MSLYLFLTLKCAGPVVCSATGITLYDPSWKYGATTHSLSSLLSLSHTLSLSYTHSLDEIEQAMCGFYCCSNCIDDHTCGDDPSEYC